MANKARIAIRARKNSAKPLPPRRPGATRGRRPKRPPRLPGFRRSRSRRAPPEQPLRTPDEHEGHHDEGQGEVEDRDEERPVGLEEPDEEGAHEGPPEVPEPADHHHDE